MKAVREGPILIRVERPTSRKIAENYQQISANVLQRARVHWRVPFLFHTFWSSFKPSYKIVISINVSTKNAS